MRYVDTRRFTPSKEWRQKSKAATHELLVKGTHEERAAYIKAKAQVWRDLRQEFINEFGSRCWFTDAEEAVAHLDIEHFRPKLQALDEDGTVHEGYWWLAFELSNLRLAGQIPNRQHKQCYFPLLPGCTRANSGNRRWQEENPVFLDPTKLTDVALVGYDESGGMRPSPDAETDEERARVDVTDRLLGLSIHQPLIEARQRVWDECRTIIDEILKLKAEEREYGAATARTKGERECLMQELYTRTRPSTPFSSVARSCLRLSGYGWAALVATS